MLMNIVKNNSVPRFISGLFSSNMGKYNLRNSDNPNDFVFTEIYIHNVREALRRVFGATYLVNDW